ncbi:hypothetical protein LIER_19236 [Lithospermum erythrorhizon]|uniref:Pectinesterase inhibitor domain-containing protein n=1 Tax=Lithospermum erythrorhizon TaxID=34254 RepID=A0AAV3QJN8_LITER
MFVYIKTLMFFALIQTFLPSLIHADLINDVCAQSDFPAYCESVMRSPKNPHPDLTMLGQIATSALRNTATNTIVLFNNTLNKNDKGQELSDALVDCMGYYKAILSITDHCTSSLIAKDYPNLVRYATMIKFHTKSCYALIEPFHLDVEVLDANYNEGYLASILQVIGSMFPTSKRS